MIGRCNGDYFLPDIHCRINIRFSSPSSFIAWSWHSPALGRSDGSGVEACQQRRPLIVLYLGRPPCTSFSDKHGPCAVAFLSRPVRCWATTVLAVSSKANIAMQARNACRIKTGLFPKSRIVRSTTPLGYCRSASTTALNPAQRTSVSYSRWKLVHSKQSGTGPLHDAMPILQQR
jgi:hypothetical protein